MDYTFGQDWSPLSLPQLGCGAINGLLMLTEQNQYMTSKHSRIGDFK